ncbi:MAG: hypothetical protein QOH89_3411 [Pseudonocardiales bacterium]|nr:hypothetical protein [Pseudonocardiales bacterium]
MPRAIATNRTVDLNELLAFVRPRHSMILLTRRRDGSGQVTPPDQPDPLGADRRRGLPRPPRGWLEALPVAQSPRDVGKLHHPLCHLADEPVAFDC